jgi:hypothetical protein
MLGIVCPSGGSRDGVRHQKWSFAVNQPEAISYNTIDVATAAFSDDAVPVIGMLTMSSQSSRYA